VRELGDAERRAVARAEGGELPEILRKREMRCKTRHMVALDDDRAVVPRRMRIEDAPQKRLADLAVERDAAHDMARERIVARYDDQRADAVFRKIGGGAHKRIGRLRLELEITGRPPAPDRDALENLPELLLKDDNDHDQEDREEALKDPRRQLQLELPRD